MIVVFPGESPTISVADEAFIATALGQELSASGLKTMLHDPDAVQIILEDERLYRALIDRQDTPKPSARLKTSPQDGARRSVTAHRRAPKPSTR